MPHALATFLRERMDERKLRNRDVEVKSGLSRQLVSKYVADDRERLTRLPDRATLEGFALALGVPTEYLLSKAVEALGLGYTTGDFVNAVATASNDELLAELAVRLDSPRDQAARSVTPALPTVAAQRGARRRRVQQEGMPQTEAAYDDDEGT